MRENQAGPYSMRDVGVGYFGGMQIRSFSSRVQKRAAASGSQTAPHYDVPLRARSRRPAPSSLDAGAD